MAYYLPNHAHIASKASDVADNLDRGRHSGGFLTGGQIKQGEALMDGSRILLQHCGQLINDKDQAQIRKKYNEAIDARAKLDASDMSMIRRYLKAKEFKRLSGKTFQITKRASDRALDNDYLGRLGFGGTDPPAGASPSTPEESDGTDPAGGTGLVTSPTHGIFRAGALPLAVEEPDGAGPSAGAPATPEEPDRLSRHDHFTASHTAATSTRIQDIEMTTLSLGDPMDDVHETYSFIYPDADFAASATSVASYLTERTVNSRKSRYNAPPRRKYADGSHLGVDDGSVTETESMDEYYESQSSPLSDRRISPKPRPPLDEPHAAQSATEHVHCDAQPPSPRRGVVSPAPSSDHSITTGES